MIKRIRLGIDQGTGASSAMGVALYDPNTDELLGAWELRPSMRKPSWQRIRDITLQAKSIIDTAIAKHGPLEVRFEGVVLRNRGGQILAWSVGAIIGHIPLSCTVSEVHNITLKRFITGNAGADKRAMGEGLIRYFEKLNKGEALDAVRKLIDNNMSDAIDAVCIAVCPDVIEG